MDLGAEALQSPPDQVWRQVGDDADAVRQINASREGRTTLVVDEQERHPVRAVRMRHAQHPSLQELRLPGARGAANQGMRPLRAQINGERLRTRMPDHGPQIPGPLPGNGG